MYKSYLIRFIQFLCIFILFSNSSVYAGWQLEWIDDFDGTRVDRNNWTQQTQANFNAEVQCYTDDDTSVNKNYDVSNGTLKIISRKGAHSCAGLGGQTRSWTSGRINSKDKREFLFGRIEARLRFNDLRGGTWPAFWMLENRINEQPFRGDNDFVGWPNPGAGEIDVWEWYSRGSNSYITNFFNTSNCGSEIRYNYPGGAADVLQWHNYAIEWDQNSIKFFIDNSIVASHDVSNCAQYKEPMFILLNVAMGGTLGGAIDPTLTTATMEVDYVAHCSANSGNNVTSCNANTPMATVPQISSNPVTQAVSNTSYNYRLIANDADGDNLTFSAPILPQWLSFNDSSGVLSGTPSAADIGFHSIVLSVTDGTTAVSQNFTINVSAPVITQPQNLAPVITSNAINSVEVGEIYTYKIEASDADGDNLFYTQHILPNWLSFDTTTGVLRGTPSSTNVGNHAVELRVNDGRVAVRQNFTITVVAAEVVPAPVDGTPITPSNPIAPSGPNNVPFFTSSSTNTASVNNEYSYTLIASDPDSDELLMSATVLPNWLSFDPDSGVLTGTPSNADVGNHDVTLVVSDGRATISQTFVIHVSPSSSGESNELETSGTSASSGGGRLDLFLISLLFLILVMRRILSFNTKDSEYVSMSIGGCLVSNRKTTQKWGGVILKQFFDVSLEKS